MFFGLAVALRAFSLHFDNPFTLDLGNRWSWTNARSTTADRNITWSPFWSLHFFCQYVKPQKIHYSLFHTPYIPLNWPWIKSYSPLAILILSGLNKKSYKVDFLYLHQSTQHINGSMGDPIILPLQTFDDLYSDRLATPDQKNKWENIILIEGRANWPKTKSIISNIRLFF